MDDQSVSSYESIDHENETAIYNHTHEHVVILFKLSTSCLKGLDLCPYSPTPSVQNWRALGLNIGICTSLKYLQICADGLDEEEDIATTDNLETFVRGIAQNRSVEHLLMEQYDFSRARLELIHPFIIENDNLIKLSLCSCNFGLDDLQMLATAFSQRRNPTSMKYLRISGSNIDDESVPILVEISRYCPRLQHLDLMYMREDIIGVQGLIHLATYLEDPRCSIKCLYLKGVTDEGARVLANSLVNNKKLKSLAVFLHGRITSIGWEYFHSILRSTSSIDATLNCNHTLERLWEPSKATPRDIPEELLFCLNLNRFGDKTRVIRTKIFHCHLNDNKQLSSLIGTDQDILHNLLGWIGKDLHFEMYPNDNIIRTTAFYRIIRGYPDLCGFETFDRKMRRQLEVENATLKADVANLKAENEELRRKNEQLTNRK